MVVRKQQENFRKKKKKVVQKHFAVESFLIEIGRSFSKLQSDVHLCMCHGSAKQYIVAIPSILTINSICKIYHIRYSYVYISCSVE